MTFSSDWKGREEEIAKLFEASFSASEGPEEGRLIAALVRDLLETTKRDDLFVFLALQEELLLGAVLFSRLTFPEDQRIVFILSPLAVAPDWQGKGHGQALLKHSLQILQTDAVDLAITYGDPNYYVKVGFHQISEEEAQPPFKLEQPEGWLAKPLSSSDFVPLKGPSFSVEALADQSYW